MSGDLFNGYPEDGEPVSEEQDQKDYEALNAETALNLNKAQQLIEQLEAEVEAGRKVAEDLWYEYEGDTQHFSRWYDKALAALGGATTDASGPHSIGFVRVQAE